MERHAAFPHPLLRLRRAGDREIRARDARPMPIPRRRTEKED